LTIGGDDTVSGAAAVARVLGGKLAAAHVPKTIDNDLPLPPGVPTLLCAAAAVSRRTPRRVGHIRSRRRVRWRSERRARRRHRRMEQDGETRHRDRPACDQHR
jgi:hypothetical protein